MSSLDQRYVHENTGEIKRQMKNSQDMTSYKMITVLIFGYYKVQKEIKL